MTPFFKNKFQEILFLGITLFTFVAFYVETDIYTPSFPEMVQYFGANEDAIQLLLSINFLGVLCLVICLAFYFLLYRKNQHKADMPRTA
jgi:DHA1 family bicyclomycin/chloramphenicol resistance-like MFS transporter